MAEPSSNGDREWPEAFLEALGGCPDFPDPPERTPLQEARGSFGR